MNGPNDRPQEEGRTTLLHLDKISAGTSAQTGAVTYTEESGTIVISKAAAQAAQQEPQGVVLPKSAQPAAKPGLFLSLLAYCYSKDVYRSEEIEQKMRRDPDVCKAFGGQVPDAHAIRRFRRLNRNVLAATMEKLFIWKRRKAAVSGAASEASLSSPTQACQDSPSVIMARQQAAEKVEEAAAIDNILKDE